ncbi:MAG: GAF domain-containing protein [Actinomycetota bacterium]|nr:GAF domain-containing protein [Actinomycetota bacterium]
MPENERGRSFLIDLLSTKRVEIIKRIVDQKLISSSFYSTIRQTPKKYLNDQLGCFLDAIKFGETLDFLGNETFQSYSNAKGGVTFDDILAVPGSIRKAVIDTIDEMLGKGEVEADTAVEAIRILDDFLWEAMVIRSKSFVQTRDEIIHFYHGYQEEIDKFPSNLAATFDTSTLMTSAVRKALKLIDVEYCAFFSRDLLTGEFHVEASNFDHANVFGGNIMKLDDQLVSTLVEKGELVIVEANRRSMPLAASLTKRLKAKEVLLVPLKVRNRNVGIMLLSRPRGGKTFTEDTIKISERFANRVAASMENARLHESEQRKLKEAMALLEVSRLVSSTLDADVLLSRLAQIAAQVYEVGKCSIYLVAGEDGSLYPAATYGTFPNSHWETSMGGGISLSELADNETKALVENHEAVILDPWLSQFIPDERIEDTGTKAVVVVPITSRDTLKGVLVLFCQKEKEQIEKDELNLAVTMAGQAAIALDNASLYGDLEMSYFSTVKSLAKAIEVKDPYTFGHSEMVTEYAVATAQKMGLSEWEIRNIKYAGALHDIGKIGIPRGILNKPEKLTEDEFTQVKNHPELGESIIEPVEFLQEPRKLILHHHERFDGSGYPSGLKGEEIPLGSRILAVADSFEAMMSDRPYRKKLGLDKAIRELEKSSGSQFDPKVVGAFMEVLKEKGMIGEEYAPKLPLHSTDSSSLPEKGATGRNT